MANINNLRMGVCSISFGGNDVGHTLGGVKIQITRKLTDLKADKYGDSPIDKVLTDVELKVTAKVAEPVIANIQKTLPEGDYQIGAAGSRLGIAAGEGASMRAYAQQLVLHPYSKAASDFSEDFTVYLAVPVASPTVNYDVAGQRVFDIEFDALVSESFVAGRRLGHMGPTNVS